SSPPPQRDEGLEAPPRPACSPPGRASPARAAATARTCLRPRGGPPARRAAAEQPGPRPRPAPREASRLASRGLRGAAAAARIQDALLPRAAHHPRPGLARRRRGPRPARGPPALAARPRRRQERAGPLRAARAGARGGGEGSRRTQRGSAPTLSRACASTGG
ncbi:unnamed protein product, partial [Prorocentrum cordatum]